MSSNHEPVEMGTVSSNSANSDHKDIKESKDDVPIEENEERPQWRTRFSFLAAAIGSAVGLGNIWRFPYLCNKFGGGAFLIPYVFCLVMIGHPILQLELSMGQKFRSGDIDAFGSINKRFRGIGLASIFGAYVIVWYYTAVIAWACVYFVSSFRSIENLPFNGFTHATKLVPATGVCNVMTNVTYPIDWMSVQAYQHTIINSCDFPKENNSNLPFKLVLGSMTCGSVISELEPYYDMLNGIKRNIHYYSVQENISCIAEYNKTEKTPKAESFFYTDTLLLSSGIDVSESKFNANLVGALIVVYIMMFAAVFNGVKSASWVVYFTMPVPFILLFALLIQGLLLDGAGEGIKEYLSIDFSLISNSAAWSAATGQTFFSLGVCMGIMTAYSSYNPENQDVVSDNHIIALADTMASFFGGFVVYSVLGFLFVKTGDEDVFGSGGPGLTFVTYPQALAQMPAGNVWGGLFFFCLILLGIDSAFSLVEALATVITDRIGHGHQIKVVSLVIIVSFLLSLRFVVDTGLYWLDLIDHYVNNYGMIFVGMMECVVVGWFYEKKGQREQVGPALDFFKWSTFLVTVLSVALGLGLAAPVKDIEGVITFEGGLGNDAAWYALFGGLAVWAVCIWMSVIKVVNYRKAKGQEAWLTTMILWELCGWHGPEMLREMINPPTEKEWNNLNQQERCAQCLNCNRVGIIWGWLIKYFIPPVLWLMLCANIRRDWYTPYSGYPMRYQAVGLLFIFIMLLMIILPLIEPDLMKPNDESDDHPNKPKKKIAATSSTYASEEKGLKSLQHDATRTDEENAKLIGA